MDQAKDQANGHHPDQAAPAGSDASAGQPTGTAPNKNADGATGEQANKPQPRMLILVRHGQATFNVEGKHPGQLAGIPLTDDGRRQAHTAAVALAALPISAIVASPLERARETAEIIARGWDLPVYLDARLKDTDVGPFAGKTGNELSNDPAWKQFLEHPDQPPAGVESLADVEKRAIAAITDILHDPSLGAYVVVVAHADIVKLVLGHFLNITTESARHIGIGNASLSALLFHTSEQPPEILSLNWSPLPHWLHAPVPHRAETPPSALPAEPPSEEAAATAPGASSAGTAAQQSQGTGGNEPHTPTSDGRQHDEHPEHAHGHPGQHGSASGQGAASSTIPRFLDFI